MHYRSAMRLVACVTVVLAVSCAPSSEASVIPVATHAVTAPAVVTAYSNQAIARHYNRWYVPGPAYATPPLYYNYRPHYAYPASPSHPYPYSYTYGWPHLW